MGVIDDYLAKKKMETELEQQAKMNETPSDSPIWGRTAYTTPNGIVSGGNKWGTTPQPGTVYKGVGEIAGEVAYKGLERSHQFIQASKAGAVEGLDKATAYGKQMGTDFMKIFKKWPNTRPAHPVAPQHQQPMDEIMKDI